MLLNMECFIDSFIIPRKREDNKSYSKHTQVEFNAFSGKLFWPYTNTDLEKPCKKNYCDMN